MSNAFILSEMTWVDAKAAFAQAELAIIPTGSFEQHAPYMTFEVDTARASAFGKLLAERLYPRVILAPPIAFGISHHHMNFPGTITLSHDTFNAILFDVIKSLRAHGLKQFFIVNGHGGNAPSLNVIDVRLHHELGVRVAWSGPTSLASEASKALLSSDNNGHCSQGETSQAMYLAPQVVRRDRIVRGTVKPYPYKFIGKGSGVNAPYMWDEITGNGALGDATLASDEIGGKIIQAALNKGVEFLIDFMDKNKTAS